MVRVIRCFNCWATFPYKWGTMDLEKHSDSHKFQGFEVIEITEDGKVEHLTKEVESKV